MPLPAPDSSASVGLLVNHDDRTLPYFGRSSIDEQQTIAAQYSQHGYFVDNSGHYFDNASYIYSDPSWQDAACTVEQATALAYQQTHNQAACIAPLDTQLDYTHYADPLGASPITDGSSDTNSIAATSPRAAELHAQYASPTELANINNVFYPMQHLYTSYTAQPAPGAEFTSLHPQPMRFMPPARPFHPRHEQVTVAPCSLSSVVVGSASAPGPSISSEVALVTPQPRLAVNEVGQLLQRYISRAPTPDLTYEAHRQAALGVPAEYLASSYYQSVVNLPEAVVPADTVSNVVASPKNDLEPVESVVGPQRVPKRRKKTPEPRRPMTMACLFCRGRKIACSAPPADFVGDRTCDQCRKRDQVCVFPKECKRGFKRSTKPKVIPPPLTDVPAARRRQQPLSYPTHSYSQDAFNDAYLVDHTDQPSYFVN